MLDTAGRLGRVVAGLIFLLTLFHVPGNARNENGGLGRRSPDAYAFGGYCAASTMMPMFLAPLARAISRNFMVES